MAKALDYKNPSTPNVRQLRSVHQHLRTREQMDDLKILLLFAAGVPATFIGPVIIQWLILRVGFAWDWHLPYLMIFLGVIVVVVPLLFRAERRYGATHLNDVVHGSFVGSTMSFNTWQAMAGFYCDPGLMTGMLVEISLWGPRQIYEAVDRIRVTRFLRGDKRNRAADALTALSSLEQGAPVDQLGRPNEPLSEVLSALAYLLVYDWIGVSKDGRKVWITSASRKTLDA